jgi:asparagine synthase (glutamine-hydrolysing)
LQFNYIPGRDSIFKGVKKINPGHYLKIRTSSKEGEFKTIEVNEEEYYQIPKFDLSKAPFLKGVGEEYGQAQTHLIKLLEESVRLRLISDVPLGAFLSGGIDSSIIVALASQHTKQLNTFSIGYKDEPLFDETHFAKLVADQYKTNHTVFSLTNDDLFANLHKVLDYIDEPFADSSALAVNILSMHTRKHVTVALSGDGADELFSGYNKHAAEYKARNAGMLAQLIKIGTPLWKILPQSRNSRLGNKFRQLYRFGEGMKLSAKDRYWRWATFADQQEALQMLSHKPDLSEFSSRRDKILESIRETGDMNEVLYTDMQLVLQNDMLAKVDLMSMENALEVRVPFLDWRVVNFVMSLPENYKIDKHSRKKILQDAFRKYLPEELYHRPKHGFEVPLLKWFRTELKSMITNDLLSDKFIGEQDIFQIDTIRQLKKRLFSNNPGDVHAQIWALIVFQYWWKKYMA